jgi:hypothetical protein
MAEKSNDWQFFDNTKDLLAFIATEYGNDALFGRKHFSDHTAPSMPQGQKNLVKQAFVCGAVKILQDNMESDQPHKEIAVKQAVGKMVDTYASAKEAASRVVWEFTNAIGWGMEEPITLPTSGGGVQNPPSSASNPQPSPNPVPVPIISPGEIGKLMILGWQSADIGDWDEAGKFFAEARKTDPSYAPAFLGLICVDLKASKADNLVNIKDHSSITGHKFYKLATADPAIKTQFDGYVQRIKDQNEFDTACKNMSSARSSSDYNKAAAMFEKIKTGFTDINGQIKIKISECRQLEQKQKTAEEAAAAAARKKAVQDQVDTVINNMNSAKTSNDYRKVISAFSNIDSNYQDINNQIKSKVAECEKKIAAIEAEIIKKYGSLLERYSAEGRKQTESRRQAAQAQLDADNAQQKTTVEAQYAQLQQKYDADYKAWQVRVHELKTSYEAAYRIWEQVSNIRRAQADAWRGQKLCPHDGGTLKGLLTKICSVCGKSPSESIAMSPAPQQPNYPAEPQRPQIPTFSPKHLNPVASAGSADIEAYVSGDAVYIISSGNNYRVVDVKGDRVLLQTNKGEEFILEGNSIKENITVGKTISFGNLEWRVLAVENNRALLISDKVLEERQYSTEYIDITWGRCSLRKYLNGEFYNKFGEAKSAIAETRNNNPNNHWYGTSGGSITTDRIFLLSLDEVFKYFGDSGDYTNKRRKDYEGKSRSVGHFVYDQYNNARVAKNSSGTACWWWLRSPSNLSGGVAYISDDGIVDVSGANVFISSGGVRPALWLNL